MIGLRGGSAGLCLNGTVGLRHSGANGLSAQIRKLEWHVISLKTCTRKTYTVMRTK